VNFKLFGGMGLMLVFVLAQAMYLGRYMDNGENAQAPPESKP
jgi:intracellular septation protein